MLSKIKEFFQNLYYKVVVCFAMRKLGKAMAEGCSSCIGCNGCGPSKPELNTPEEQPTSCVAVWAMDNIDLKLKEAPKKKTSKKKSKAKKKTSKKVSKGSNNGKSGSRKKQTGRKRT